MKKYLYLLSALLLAMASCSSDEPNPDGPDVIPPGYLITPPKVAPINGLNEATFPVIDGSDSTQPLRTMLAAALIGNYQCLWLPDVFDGSNRLCFYHTSNNVERIKQLTTKLKATNTHPSFNNLIDGSVELIISARESSDDELAYAQGKGVTLIEKPIANDSFAFMVNRANSIENLTHEQVVGIYSGKITNWKEVGGYDQPIKAFIRNRNSGSQEKMEKLVMKGTPMIDLPELVGGSMMAPYLSLHTSLNGIGYSPFYYYLNMSTATDVVKAISINGVPPTREYIRNNTYPYVSSIVAVIRSDTPADSYARKIFDYLTTSDGKKIIESIGYVAN